MFAHRHLFIEKKLKPNEKETTQPEHRQAVATAAIPTPQAQENGKIPMRPMRAKLPDVEIQWLG